MAGKLHVRELLFVLSLFALTFIQTTPAEAQMAYLGTLGGSTSTTAAINEDGWVVGWSYPAGGAYDTRHAFLWKGVAPLIDLGTLGGSWSAPAAITESGAVVGSSAGPDGLSRAFLWTESSGMTDLGTLPGTPGSGAYATNSKGQIVGTSLFPSGSADSWYWHAVFWSSGFQITDLGTLGGNTSEALAINEAGQVVGASRTENGDMRPFVWESEKGMRDLGTLGGNWGAAYAINSLGQVIGDSTVSLDGSSYNQVSRAFIWEGGTMTSLGTLGGQMSQAKAMNDKGQVVGSSTTSDGKIHAFLWTKDAGMIDLGTLPGGNTSEAFGINESGQVVGYSYKQGGNWHAFAWSNRVMTDLGPNLSGFGFNSKAFVINDSGQIAGEGQTGPYSTTVATIWSDTIPPAFTVPDHIVVDATAPEGAAVVFSASDNVDPNPTVTCSPPSGSFFPIGTTTSACSATDHTGNSTAKTFQVTVNGAIEQLGKLIALVRTFNLSQGIANSLDSKLQNVEKALTAAKENDRSTASNELGAFVNDVEAQNGKSLTSNQASDLNRMALQIKAVLG